jgi:hypothetical protein
MRTLKRLFPVFLATILLAGLATAQAAGAAGTSQCPRAGISKTQSIPGYNHAPDPLRFDFGTVVRDTADEQNVGPGRWQAPQCGSLWNSVFAWSWFSLLISN